jgi:hypothetical protein
MKHSIRRTTISRGRALCLAAALALVSTPLLLFGQEYSVRAVDSQSGKPLKGIPIVLRYECTFTGSGINTKEHCHFIHRTTGKDGIAHFPEAGSLKDVDDIFPMSCKYREDCCDISKPVIPGTGTITFTKFSFSEMWHCIFVGD